MTDNKACCSGAEDKLSGAPEACEAPDGSQIDAPAVPAGETLTPRPVNRGWFKPRNRTAWKHGLRSRRDRLPEGITDAALVEMVAAIVQDMGGAENVSKVALGQA